MTSSPGRHALEMTEVPGNFLNSCESTLILQNSARRTSVFLFGCGSSGIAAKKTYLAPSRILLSRFWGDILPYHLSFLVGPRQIMFSWSDFFCVVVKMRVMNSKLFTCGDWNRKS